MSRKGAFGTAQCDYYTQITSMESFMILDTNRKSFRTIKCPSCTGDHYGQVATEEGFPVIHVLSARMVDKK